MITASVQFQCDWCGAVEHVALDLSEAVHRPRPPHRWVLVAERVYCPQHQVFIRPRGDDEFWTDALWVEERPNKRETNDR